jgi:hypothetical protein
MVKTKFCKRQVYAVETGDYAGQMFIVVNPTTENVGCLSIPGMENVKVPRNALEHAVNSNIITFVETLPKKVYKISEAQYIKNEDPDNRRKQLNPPNISYSEKSIEEIPGDNAETS